jgi:hypothetical protein
MAMVFAFPYKANRTMLLKKYLVGNGATVDSKV